MIYFWKGKEKDHMNQGSHSCHLIGPIIVEFSLQLYLKRSQQTLLNEFMLFLYWEYWIFLFTFLNYLFQIFFLVLQRNLLLLEIPFLFYQYFWKLFLHFCKDQELHLKIKKIVTHLLIVQVHFSLELLSFFFLYFYHQKLI